MFYVGNAFTGLADRISILQIKQPGAGFYNAKAGVPIYIPSGYFLVNNPDYTYYWTDSYSDEDIPSNAVSVRIAGPNSLAINVGRVQVDGQTFVGPIGPKAGMYYTVPNVTEHFTRNYQILRCNPKPSNPCSNFFYRN
jgi:hypothetical protein